MHSIENWEAAQVDFFEAFRNYDEAGSLQRIQVLKYLVLTTMLIQSDINPFDSPETKPYVALGRGLDVAPPPVRCTWLTKKQIQE